MREIDDLSQILGGSELWSSVRARLVNVSLCAEAGGLFTFSVVTRLATVRLSPSLESPRRSDHECSQQHLHLPRWHAPAPDGVRQAEGSSQRARSDRERPAVALRPRAYSSGRVTFFFALAVSPRRPPAREESMLAALPRRGYLARWDGP